MRSLELLAPARNADIAIEALLHGADAVYMGAPDFGARKSASNSIDDISRVVDFAHIYGARVYVTVNTLVYEEELRKVEALVASLYKIGVDALIVQDMSLLRLEIPPVQLHASTQCDIRTPQKARFLQDVGFSQLVLARELSLRQIREIVSAVTVPVEVFVHGALCVCYSGRCQASLVSTGRSGNRGECAQICRLPFTLKDASGRVLEKGKHLLSLKDLNTLDNLKSLVEAGVSSFKIEGRLKDMAYVKNIVAAYSQRLDRLVEENSDTLKRASFGRSSLSFSPRPDKSFNRGFTRYFIQGSSDGDMASLHTPKSLGEKISDPGLLNPGDGISFFDSDGNYSGVLVNRVENGRIKANRPFVLPKGSEIYRTSDVKWNKMLARPSASRKLRLDVTLSDSGVSAIDETGTFVRLPFENPPEKANAEHDYSPIFSKLGNTPFLLSSFTDETSSPLFFPASSLTALRRRLVDELLSVKKITYPFQYRRPENKEVRYPYKSLDCRDNVANSLAEDFYRSHGVDKIEPALECSKSFRSSLPVMTTRYCILRQLGRCLRNNPDMKLKLPLSLENGNNKFSLHFDCAHCEMSLYQSK